MSLILREKCAITEVFLVRIFLYSVQIQENTDTNNSVFEQFSSSVRFSYENAYTNASPHHNGITVSNLFEISPF